MSENGLKMQLKRCVAALSPMRRRAEIDAAARALIAEYGSSAYYVARDRSRELRHHGTKDAGWSAVARRIAKLTNHQIGITGSDKYPGP